MTKNKSGNSIFFITTLSVYLGLVLVGASPSVLAQQAALTQRFQIQNEIDVDEDLDKNPDDEIKSLIGSIGSYFENLEHFVEGLQELHANKRFDLYSGIFQLSEEKFTPCDVDGDPTATAVRSQNISNQWLKPDITDLRKRFEGWDFMSDCVPSDRVSTGTAKVTGFKLSYDKSELKVELSGFANTAYEAGLLAEKFNQANRLYEIDEDDVTVRKLSENTVFTAENNQVFIVTRLPRGSLDALVASEKQVN